MNLPEQTPTPKITPETILSEGKKLLQQLRTNEKERSARDLRQCSGESIPCLIEPLFQKKGVATLAGSSDTGKSALLRQLAAAITAGDEEWIGFPIHATHRSVVYVSTEDGAEATSFLLHRQTSHYGDEQIEPLRFIFDYDDLVPTLDSYLGRRPADLVIMDCFSDVFGGDLKDSPKIRQFLAPYQKLSDQRECLILFLHHTGKRTEHLIPSKNNLLSGQGLEAKMRIVVELRQDALRPHVRHFCVVKGNYLPANYKKESFVLHFDETNFTFTNTGERVPFELLVKGPEVDDSKAKWEKVKEMKEKKMSYSQIAEAMGFASKNSVTQLLEKAKRNGWDKLETGDTEE